MNIYSLGFQETATSEGLQEQDRMKTALLTIVQHDITGSLN